MMKAEKTTRQLLESMEERPDAFFLETMIWLLWVLCWLVKIGG